MQNSAFSLVTLILLLLFQWLLGGLVLRHVAQTHRSGWPLAARAFVRGRIVVAILLAVSLALLLRSGPSRELLGGQLPWMAVLMLGGAPSTTGGWLVLFAGLLERRGALSEARTVVWIGGRLMAAGTLVLLVALVARLALGDPSQGELLEPLLAATGLATAGFSGLLAGLTRKSRPTGPFAVALYLVALTALHGMA